MLKAIHLLLQLLAHVYSSQAIDARVKACRACQASVSPHTSKTLVETLCGVKRQPPIRSRRRR